MTKLRKTRHFAPLVAVLLVFSLTACPSAQQWVDVALQVIPVVEPIIVAGVQGFAQLQGKTISAADMALIQSTATEVRTDLQTAKTLTQQYQANQDPSLVGKINTLLDGVVGKLAQILAGMHVKDAATLQKITAFVNLVVGEVKAVENMIPLFRNGKLMARPKVKGQTTPAPLTASELKAKYNRFATTPSGNSDVDQAFAGRTLP